MDKRSKITVQEAAERVGVTPAAVYARIAAGQMPSEQVFGRAVIDARHVEAWRRERLARARQVLGMEESHEPS